jgi:Carboxypeptidase regulatory-like domain
MGSVSCPVNRALDLYTDLFPLEEFMLASCKKSLPAAFVVVFCLAAGFHAHAQSGGSSGSITGTVLDPSGAVVANAVVEIHNPVSGYDRNATTDNKGDFNFPNVPFNPYHLSVTAAGFAQYAQDVETRSVVPVSVKISLQVSGSSTTVTVESAGDLVENDSTFHSDIDRSLFDKLPLESTTSSLSSLVTLSTRESLRTRMASFTGSATTRRIRSPLTVSPLPTSKAKSSPTSFRSIPSSRWKLLLVSHAWTRAGVFEANGPH